MCPLLPQTHRLYRSLAAGQHCHDVGVHHFPPMLNVATEDRARVFETRIVHHDV